jgi:hypothetical protein
MRLAARRRSRYAGCQRSDAPSSPALLIRAAKWTTVLELVGDRESNDV